MTLEDIKSPFDGSVIGQVPLEKVWSKHVPRLPDVAKFSDYLHLKDLNFMVQPFHLMRIRALVSTS